MKLKTHLFANERGITTASGGEWSPVQVLHMTNKSQHAEENSTHNFTHRQQSEPVLDSLGV